MVLPRSTIRDRRFRTYDALLALRPTANGTLATSVATQPEVAREFEARYQRPPFKVVVQHGTTPASTTVNIQAVTSASTSASGTTIGSVSIGTAAGEAVVAIASETVDRLVGQVSAVGIPLYLRSSLSIGSTVAGTMDYAAFLTLDT